MNEHIESIEAGARNLLLNCAEVKTGDQILLIGEECDSPYFDPRLCNDIAQVAEKLGVKSETVMAKPVADASQFPPSISDAMLTVDKTIFFSRLGDQVRFVETAGNSQKIMCYTLTRKHLGSPFASINFKTMKKIDQLLSKKIMNASSYKIESACGTSLLSEIPKSTPSENSTMTDFSVDLFPVMIFPPVTFHKLQGQIVLDDFLISTSTRAFSDSVLILKSPVIAKVENSRMVAFEGDDNEIVRIKAQLERAAKMTGGDAYAINSWHTGVNPYTFFEGDPYANLEHWGTVSYGSPRYTHMHAAGYNPGDISMHLFDASISFDDELFWDKGKFVFLDKPEVQALFSDAEKQQLNSSVVLDIGM